MHSTYEQSERLEVLVDRLGLSKLLSALSTICTYKAEHLRNNWGAIATAKHWDKAALEIYNLSSHTSVKEVS